MTPTRLTNSKNREHGRTGSALILTVVLTSLLAIVGVLFLMTTRIDKMATSATAEHRQLSFAIDTLVAEIGEALAQDVPGVSAAQEYYDFPDANNVWLADLEPYTSGGAYYWRQISDVTGTLAARTRAVRVAVVGEREPVSIAGPNTVTTTADADGDGVGDSHWFEVPGVMSSRGRPIYAAVRIVDNGGMLNVNTGYKFDPNDTNRFRINGSSPLQVNILALAGGLTDPVTPQDDTALLAARAMGTPGNLVANLDAYEAEVVWRQEPTYVYTPFDLSDELELRYRYLLNHSEIDTRVENWGRFRANMIFTPVDSGGADLTAWFLRAGTTAGLDPNYAYRHIATTHNTDRIIMPQRVPTGTGRDPGIMVNVNTAGEYALRQAITAALSRTGFSLVDIPDPAQIIANLLDYIDDDSVVTVLPGATTTSQYYGFEQPCIYISELAYRFVTDQNTGEVHRSYAVELHKPYFEDRDPLPDEWRLVIDNAAQTDVQTTIAWSGTRRFHVLLAHDADASLRDDYLAFSDPQEPVDTVQRFGYDRAQYSQPTVQSLDATGFHLGATIELQRKVGTTTDTWVAVDRFRVPSGWMTEDGVARSLQRDISPHKCIRRLWASTGEVSTPSLGNGTNHFVHPDGRLVQAHPANRPLENIGELGMVFAWSAYNIPEQAPPSATNLLIDLQNPVFANLFNYLTVIDPAAHGLPFNETRVKGRININTAPPFVVAQLPWIQYEDTVPFEKARAIVDYRNSQGPYRSIAGLVQVPQLQQLAYDGRDNLHGQAPPGPDLTPDTAQDDFEERDLIFTRISDLVTVRSDVFTAYLLVRIGVDGSQKRVVAILDRSLVTLPSDPVRALAMHQVPDPR